MSVGEAASGGAQRRGFLEPTQGYLDSQNLSDSRGEMGIATQGSGAARPVDVADVVRRAGREFDAAQLRVQYRSDVLPTVAGDAHEIGRAVLALLGAVSSLAGPASRALLVSLNQTRELPAADEDPFIGSPPSGSGYVVLSVGVSQTLRGVADVRRWFEPVFTSSRLFAAEQNEPGRGARPSLAAVLASLRQQGAGLRVVPGPDGGLRLEVYFPFTDDPLDEGVVEDGGQRSQLQGQGRVLVIDDEPAVARLTGLVLDQHGFEVEVACSGSAALELITQQPSRFQLIIVDLSMPDLSGVEVLRRARALGCPAPVVLTSGHAESEADDAVKEADFAGYLQKPYRLEALLDVIERALSSS